MLSGKKFYDTKDAGTKVFIVSYLNQPLFYSSMLMKDLMVGLAIGDAFGAGVEFQSREIIKEKVDFTEFVNLRGSIQVPSTSSATIETFINGFHPWEYTDDTEMTIGVVKALLSQEEFTPDLLVKFWVNEYNEDKERKGYGRNGHGSMRWVYSGEKNINELRAFQRGRDFPGNAPPMRAVPLGLIAEDLINVYSIINADATHPHPKARVASIIVARAAHYLLREDGGSENIIGYCKSHILGLDSDTEDLLDKVDKLPAPDKLQEYHYSVLCGPQPIVSPRFLSGINGLPSDSMLTGGSVLYVLKYSRDAMDGLRNSIYMGGDVDSLASICTGILAGKHGLDSIPNFMIANVEGREKLEALAIKFEQYTQQ